MKSPCHNAPIVYNPGWGRFDCSVCDTKVRGYGAYRRKRALAIAAGILTVFILGIFLSNLY